MLTMQIAKNGKWIEKRQIILSRVANDGILLYVILIFFIVIVLSFAYVFLEK